MRHLGKLAGFMLLAQCQGSATRFLVGVDTDLSWGPDGEIASVVLEVRRGDANGPLRDRRVTALGSSRGRAPLAVWVSIVAADPDDRSPLWLEALGCARADGCTREDAVVVQRASVRFVPDQTGTLQLLLARSCLGSRCALTERCDVGRGTCVVGNAQEETRAFAGSVPDRFGSGVFRDEGTVSRDAGAVIDSAGLDDAPTLPDAHCVDGSSACDGNCRDLSSDPNHCGRCGRTCGAAQVCVAGACQSSCATGLSNCGGACQPLGRACTAGLGACARTGMTRCEAEARVVCSVLPGPASAEVCDGVDNDCDGATDEGFCRIGGTCFLPGQTDSNNDCQRCVLASEAASGATNWSELPNGTRCTSRTGGVCTGGVCTLAIDAAVPIDGSAPDVGPTDTGTSAAQDVPSMILCPLQGTPVPITCRGRGGLPPCCGPGGLCFCTQSTPLGPYCVPCP